MFCLRMLQYCQRSHMKQKTTNVYHLGKGVQTLAKAGLLILDELSYLSINRHQSKLLIKGYLRPK